MIKVAMVVPSYNRHDNIRKLAASVARFNDLLVDVSISLFVYNQGERLENLEDAIIFNVAAYDKVNMGEIRRDAASAVFTSPDQNLHHYDYMWMSDDDMFLPSIYEGHALVSDLFKKIKELNYPQYVRIIESKKSSQEIVGEGRVYLGHLTATSMNMGLGFLVKMEEQTISRIFNSFSHKCSVGEDIACHLTAYALSVLGELSYAEATGYRMMLDYDEWENKSVNTNGGIHGRMTDNGLTPSSNMVHRNAELSGCDSRVQWELGDMFHYDSTCSTYRRLRPDLDSYIRNNGYVTYGTLQFKDRTFHKFDGSNRVVFGLDKPYEYLDKLFEHWSNNTEPSRQFLEDNKLL